MNRTLAALMVSPVILASALMAQTSVPPTTADGAGQPAPAVRFTSPDGKPLPFASDDGAARVPAHRGGRSRRHA